MLNRFIMLDTYIAKPAASSTINIDSAELTKTAMSSFFWVFKEFWPYLLILVALKVLLNFVESKLSRKKKKSRKTTRVEHRNTETVHSGTAKRSATQSKPDPLKSRIKGIVGESSVFIILESLPKEYIPMHNVMLETAKGTTQIDHIVVSPYGVFVIETKNYKGWIYGKADEYYWTQALSGKNNRFYNPIKQNEGHINALKRIVGNVPFHSIVVFSDTCELKTKPNGVIYESELQNTINAYRSVVLTKEQVHRVESAILGENIIDRESREGHTENLRSRYGR